MQPSSLIFLAIIAIWAAYVLQHWVRHRDHLATARSVDRFSEAMRVLDRRLPVVEAAGPAVSPRSYAVSPARPARPEVVVKRASSSSPAQPARPAAPVTVGRLGRAFAGMSARRLRGLSFLVSLFLVVATPVVAAFGAVSWWAVVAAVGLLAADLAVLRRAAQRSRRGARATGQARRRPSSAGATAVVSTTSAPADTAEGDVEDGAAAVPAEPAAVTPAEQELAPGTWAPVPVPRPTYTLKARAERVEPAASAPTPSTFDGVVEEGELDGLLDRRRAAGA